MKKIFTILFLVCVVPFMIAENYHTYKMEPVKTFKIGTGPENFTINFRDEYPNGPTAMAFNEKGELFFSDPLNQRLLQLDSNLNYKTEHKNVFSINVSPIFYAKNNMINYSGYGHFFYDRAEAESYEKYITINLNISRYQNNLDRRTDYLLYKDIFFVRLKDGKLIALKNPGLDAEENNRNILDYNQVLVLFVNGKYYDLTVDKKNRFFLNGELLTVDYLVFLDYWNEAHMRNKNKKQPSLSFTMKADDLDKSSTNFLGKDNSGNYYWNDNYGVAVFDQNGFMIDLFIPEPLKKKIAPALHPSGDIFFVDYDTEELRIYRIQRRW